MNSAMAALVVLACAVSADAVADDLEARISESDGWAAYRVPRVAGVDGPCCRAVRSGASTRKGCNLDEDRWSFTSDGDTPVATTDDTLAVYVRVAHGRIERVRAVGASCPVQTASTVRWIEAVEPTASVALLSSVLDRSTADEAHDQALVAIAHHAHSSATRALAARAEPSHPRKQRENALFWLGQTRGPEGADVVERYATTDADPDLRAHAVFALSQSAVPAAYPHILAIAHRDPAEHVRGQALFWLAQMDDARAKDDITAFLEAESSDEVRDEAVFALSQLDGSAADEALIAILRGDYPRDVKKRAMFWLGQSGSPQALAYFDEALR